MWNLCAIQTHCAKINVHKYLFLDQVYKRTETLSCLWIRLSCIMSCGGTTATTNRECHDCQFLAGIMLFDTIGQCFREVLRLKRLNGTIQRERVSPYNTNVTQVRKSDTIRKHSVSQ